VPGIGCPEFTNAVPLSEPPPTLEVVASRHIEDASTLTLAPDQGRKVLERINARNMTTGTRPEKRTRRGRGKRKDKVTAATQGGTENIPPTPATQQNTQSRRRRARGSGYVDTGTRPAARRGRTTSSVGGVVTANVVNYVTSQTAGTIVEDIKTTGHHGHVDGAHEHGRSAFDAGVGPKGRAKRRLPSQGDTLKKLGPGLDVEMPKAVKDRDVKTADGLTSEENHRRSAATMSSTCRETRLPESTTEGDISTVHPLPSSTRRRAKEYFQRRTRERSVDAAGRPQRRYVTLGELETRASVQVPRPQPDLNSGETVNAPANTPGKSEANRDRFVFDPEASPFTPNATSSPRQTTLSSIGVQSFSSPTPLPSHGNRKVVPLVLPETSDRSTWQETKRDSVPQLVPLMSHANMPGPAYTHAGAQAHLQAEQIALLRLQAYYNWLAGSVQSTGVGIHGCEHMDMSGGLSGGVALGRPVQVQGRGKGQCRNASGAYAHPKEHVVFSPRDHEQTEIGSHPAPQQQTGIVQSGNGESEKEERRGKWDGKWGLREVAGSGKEIGWNWGMGDLLDPRMNKTK
jgi:hypothetical protein